MPNTILVTDAEGLVGAYVIRALLSVLPPEADVHRRHKILAGYHSPSGLEKVQDLNTNPDIVKPVLVDWNNESTYAEAVQSADSVLLLTLFTSQKADQVESWMHAIRGAAETRFGPTDPNHSEESVRSGVKANKTVHVVHIGLHTSPTASDRPSHESWFLDAEQRIKHVCQSSSYLTHTLLRLNFDGYNTLLRPGKVAYYLPTGVRYGWMAREDIAAFAAHILNSDSAINHGRVFVLSASLISLDEMASSASGIVGFPIKAENLSISAFEQMALAAQSGDEGYTDYIRSVARMFEGIAKGYFSWHQEAYPEQFEALVGRKPMEFGEWLENSEFRHKLAVRE